MLQIVQKSFFIVYQPINIGNLVRFATDTVQIAT